MKRAYLLLATSLSAFAAFVVVEAAGTRPPGAPERESTVTVRSAGLAEPAPAARRPEAAAVAVTLVEEPSPEVLRRLEESAANTYIGDVLSAHDSSLARWAERTIEPLRVWVQPTASITDWSPELLPIVRDAFVAWGDAGLPLNFTFVKDSASADVHVTWIDRFREPISGKTLWTHDERWFILQAQVIIAIHHQSGEVLDTAATRAIALHEVGHLLGLDHTRDTTAIMAPRVKVKSLAPIDRATARLLYSLPPGKVRR